MSCKRSGTRPRRDPSRERNRRARLPGDPDGLIQPNPGQPRKRFDQHSIEALAGSLADAGVVQPLIVRPSPTAATS